MKKYVAFLVCLLLLVFSLALIACENKEAAVIEQYNGTWYCYKEIDAQGETHDYRTLVGFIDRTIEIYPDKTYINHYYFSGKDIRDYPKVGTYEVDEGCLYLLGDIVASAGISNESLIVTTTDGSVLYFQNEPLPEWK